MFLEYKLLWYMHDLPLTITTSGSIQPSHFRYHPAAGTSSSNYCMASNEQHPPVPSKTTRNAVLAYTLGSNNAASMLHNLVCS